MQALIEACHSGRVDAEVALVLSNQAGAAGLAHAAAAGIATRIVPHKEFPDRASFDAALDRALLAAGVDFICLAGFMRLLTPGFIAKWRDRAINIHPSLLPAFAGMHAVRDALGYGVKVTGCTVFLVDLGTDTGPVIAQAAVGVREDDDEASLHERIKVTERALLVETVGRMVRDGWSVQGRTVLVGRQETGAARQAGRA